MNVLFSGEVSKNTEERLCELYPDIVFIFKKNMNEASQYIDNASVLVTFGTDLTSDLINQANSLKWIMVLSAGMDEMPLTTIKEKGIRVTNVSGIHKYPMAEYAMSMLLQVYRQEKTLIHHEKNNVWDQSVQMQELTGKTMLIAGTGAIGQEVARLAKAFRMTVYGVSRSGRPLDYFDKNLTHDDMPEVLPNVNMIVSVLPSTAETVNFFRIEHFKDLPGDAVFLNMGRGDVVKEDVLLQAIYRKMIAHAVLDVFEQEPLPEDHPFWKEPNITITPHLSGVSANYEERALEIFEQNLNTFINNGSNFVNEVDLIRGY